jgi:hypothetical protein
MMQRVFFFLPNLEDYMWSPTGNAYDCLGIERKTVIDMSNLLLT